MNGARLLLLATAVAWAGAAHAVDDGEIRQWVGEFTGAAIAVEELATGYCSDFTRLEPVDIAAWYSWGSSLASPLARAAAEARKDSLMAQARENVRRWISTEIRHLPDGYPLHKACRMQLGIFRTVRDAAESELEDAEHQLRGRVTPRAER